MKVHIDVDRESIARFCRGNRIRRLPFSGSVSRDDFGPESGVDVLVEFEADANVGLYEFVDLQGELSELLGRDVDLHEPASLSHFFRDKIVGSAETALLRERDRVFIAQMQEAARAALEFTEGLTKGTFAGDQRTVREDLPLLVGRLNAILAEPSRGT